MKHLNWIIAFLLLAILLAGCQDEYGYSAQTDPDVVMAQNLLSESQQLDRERAAIAAEDAQLSADAIAFTQGPERDFLSTLNEQETLAYKKLLPAYVSAANEAEIDASLREVFRALPKEKAFRFGQFILGVAGNKKSAAWCLANSVTKTQGEDIDAFGGVLVPEEFEADIITLREQYGVF